MSPFNFRVRPRAAALALAAGLVLLLGPGSARADDPARGSAKARARARALHKSALVHYNLGEYAQAIDEFKRAYELHQAPELLFNLAQAHRLNGDCAAAFHLYSSYLRQRPDDPHRAEIEAQTERMRACRDAGTKARSDADASVETNDGSGAEPGSRATPGRADGATAETEQPAPASDSLVPGAAPAEAHDNSANGRRGMRRWGGALMIAGGALALTGGYFALDARTAADDVSEFYARAADGGNSAADRADIADIDRRGRRSEKLAIGLGATGVVAAAGGLVLYVLGRRESGRSIAFDISPNPGGAQWAVSWSF